MPDPRFIVRLEPGVWLHPTMDDPCGRTLVESSARQYRSRRLAELALMGARQYRPFPSAAILEVSHA